jgi:hypothetical protein
VKQKDKTPALIKRERKLYDKALLKYKDDQIAYDEALAKWTKLKERWDAECEQEKRHAELKLLANLQSKYGNGL